MNQKNYRTADINSALNRMPLDEQSRRLTQFLKSQQFEFNRLIHGISIEPTAFTALKSKFF